MQRILLTLILCLAAAAAAAEAYLTVHNNTDATLNVETVNIYDTAVYSDAVTIAPNSSLRFPVPMGQSRLLVEASRMKPPLNISREISFLRTGEYQVELFAADFGTSFMADAPGAAATPALEADGCSVLIGTWAWFVNGDVVFHPDGTHVQGTNRGTWTCDGADVTMTWSHGYFDTLTLAGTRLDGTGRPEPDTGGRWAVWGERRD